MSPTQVKRIRKRLGLSQGKLAMLLGCRLNTVWRWEAGTHPPSPPYARLLTMAGQIQADVDAEMATRGLRVLRSRL